MLRNFQLNKTCTYNTGKIKIYKFFVSSVFLQIFKHATYDCEYMFSSKHFYNLPFLIIVETFQLFFETNGI